MAGGLPAAAGGEPPKIPPRPCRAGPEGEQPSDDELRAAWELEMDREAQERKDELQDF